MDDFLAALLGVPLVFHQEQAQLERDSQRCAEVLSRGVPLCDFHSKTGPSAFLSRTAAVQSGALTIVNGIHTPICGASSNDQGLATFYLPFHGEARFGVEGRWWCSRAGETAVLMSGQAHRGDTDFYGGVVFSLPPQRLARAAAALLGDPASEERLRPAFDHPHEFNVTDRRQRNLLALMRRSLALIDLVPGRPAILPATLPLDDLLSRLVVLLVHPWLLEVAPRQALEPGRRPQQRETGLEATHQHLHGDGTEQQAHQAADHLLLQFSHQPMQRHRRRPRERNRA